MSIYDQNEAQISNDLLPPPRRLPKFKAWLSSLLSPVQWDHDLLFSNGWADGSNASNWVSGNNYIYGDRVIDIDGAVYECYNTSGLISDVIHPQSDPDNWIKILDTFIGIRERSYYTSQKIFMEFSVNRFFQVGSTALPFTGASHVNQIYLSTNYNSYTNFYLSNGSPLGLTSYMSNGTAQRNFLGNAYTINTNNFTIYCPTATANSIGANQPYYTGITFINGQSTAGFTNAQIAAGNAIMAFINKYVQANFGIRNTTPITSGFNFILY